MQRILDVIGWAIFVVFAGLLVLFVLAVIASAAFADCTPADPAQVYDASGGTFSACPVDPAGLSAACTILLIGEDGATAAVPVASPKPGVLVTFAVPSGVYGENGSAVTDCQDAKGRRAVAVLYPKVKFPPAPTPGQLLLAP